MEVVYFPDMYLSNEILLKQHLLSWGRVSTIVPPSQKHYIDDYLRGKITHETHNALELYKRIYDLTGEPIMDFLVISGDERRRASERMFDLICNWNADTHFYNDLKIDSLADLEDETDDWYWMYQEKIEKSLVNLLKEESLVLQWADGEIVGSQQIGKSYMSIIASEIKNGCGARIITDDPYYLAAKAGCDLVKVEQNDPSSFQPLAVAIPQAHLSPEDLNHLSWREIFKIRSELLPYAEDYHREIEQYHERINQLTIGGEAEEAYNTFCEFCDRVSVSFSPFAKERGKLIRHAKDVTTLSLITGID